MTPAPIANAPQHPFYNIPLHVQLLTPRATIPAYHSEHAAGFDLAACLPDDNPITIHPGQIIKVPLGFAVAFPQGFELQIRPRSGLATKHGISIPNSPGTVDADYRGEMIVALINLSQTPFQVTHTMRIAQAVLAPVCRAHITQAQALPETSRGSGGFGSTGL